MNILIKILTFYVFSFLIINIEAMEEGNVSLPDSSSLSSGAGLIPSESETSFHTLLGCIKISLENYEKCDLQLIGFVNSISISPKARDLLSDIKNQHGSVELCLPPKTQIASHACWILGEKKILIRSDYVNNLQQFSKSLLWESCNAANFRLHTPSLLQLCPDEDTYAFLVEFSEYFSGVRSNNIKIDYLRIAQQNSSLKSMIEKSGGTKISEMIDSAVAFKENFMEYWHSVNQAIIGSNFQSFEYNTDLYRHSDVYRSYHHYWKNRVPQEGPYHLSDNEQYLIVHAFSQRSFDLAKKETKLLKPSKDDRNLKK